MKYTERVTIRLTKEQHKVLKRIADEQGKTMTIVLREHVKEMLTKADEDDL